MFHLLSQIWSLLLTPTNALVVALAAGALLGGGRTRPGFWNGLGAIAGGLLCAIAILPVGDAMLEVLERRFPEPAQPPPRVTGIILVGGSVRLREVGGALRPQANDSSDRLFVAADLARRYRTAKVVVVGGPANPATGKAEADFAADYLHRLGVAEDRIVEERQSADTFENARNAADLLHPAAGDRWVLVTSAFHMPRAVGAFRKAGFAVTPAPADRRVVASWRNLTWSATDNLRAFDTAAREFLGLAAYYQAGRTSEVFPGP